MTFHRVFSLIAILAVALLPPPPAPLGGSCAEEDNNKLRRFSFAERHMGTKFAIIVHARDEKTAKKASKEAFARVAELNGIMSDYLSTSELMKLCAKAGGAAVKVSADLFTVVARAQKVSAASEGTFDITVGPVVRLWRLVRSWNRIR